MIFFYNLLNDVAPRYWFDILPVLNDSRWFTKAQKNLELTQFYIGNTCFRIETASVTLSFHSVFDTNIQKKIEIQSGTGLMLKSEIYHSFTDSKTCFQSISKLMKIQFLMYI